MNEIVTVPPRTRPLILIADDDLSIRALLRLALEEEGYEVEESVNGEDCLGKYERLQPDLVLLDAVMPEMDGLTCCQHLRALTDARSVPILMITFLDDRESIDRAFTAGATDYITKPIHWSVLRQRVKRLLVSSRLWQEAETILEKEAWEGFIRQILRQSRQSLAISDILAGAREFFRVERIVLYPRDELPVIESVAPGYPPTPPRSASALEAGYGDRYRQGQTVSIDDLDRAELSSDSIERLAGLGTRSLLLVPLLAHRRFRGLLCVHRATGGDAWPAREVERLTDLADILALGMEG